MSISAEKRVVIFCLLLIAITLAFYNPLVLNHFTQFDDDAYILKNPQIQSGLTWATVKWSFTTFHAGNWHPLAWLSHALDYQIFHLNPVGHHYVNLLLHAANAVLLFLLLWRATGFAWSSLFVAALFALHPMNVESVAWAAERKNVLSMLFFLLTLHAYDGYARKSRRTLFWLATVLFAFGLMAKPQIVTLPFVLLLWDYWPLRRIGADSPAAVLPEASARSLGFLVWEKWPFFALAAADSVVTVIAQRSGAAIRTAQEVSLSARFENALISYARYLGKMLWPSHLAPIYPHPGNSLPAWQAGAAAILLVLISALVWQWRDRRYLLVGWLWFLGTLIPMIGIITVGEQAMADRYAYIPFIGLWIAIVWGIAALVSRYRVASLWPGVAAVLTIIILGSLTYRQLGYWRDDETLWRYTLSVTQRNYMAHDNLALALAKQGRSDEAVNEFQAAEVLHRYPPSQILALALYETRVGHFREAIDNCDSVLQSSNDRKVQAAAWSERAQAQLEAGHDDEAATNFQNALRLNPDDPLAMAGTAALTLKEESQTAITSRSSTQKLTSVSAANK